MLSVKTKHYLLLICGVFLLLFFVFIKTANMKYVLFGVSSLFGGVWSRIYNINHPLSKRQKQIYTTGAMAWYMLILLGIYLIFYCSYLIKTTGIW